MEPAHLVIDKLPASVAQAIQAVDAAPEEIAVHRKREWFLHLSRGPPCKGAAFENGHQVVQGEWSPLRVQCRMLVQVEVFISHLYLPLPSFKWESPLLDQPVHFGAQHCPGRWAGRKLVHMQIAKHPGALVVLDKAKTGDRHRGRSSSEVARHRHQPEGPDNAVAPLLPLCWAVSYTHLTLPTIYSV